MLFKKLCLAPPPCANATKGYLTTKPETDEHDLEDDDDDND